MDKLLNLIGLAKKAGKLEVGEEPVGAAARSKHARLILIASDAADNTRRRALLLRRRDLKADALARLAEVERAAARVVRRIRGGRVHLP